MELNLSEHIVCIKIVSLKGRIDAFCAPAFREELNHLLAKGDNKFLIDLSEISFLDSAGMAVLVSLLKSARQSGGEVKLVLPSEEAARRILRLTRFDRVFEVADTLEAALAKF